MRGAAQQRGDELERTLRDTLRDKRSVYESGKDMLARHFRDVDDGSGDVDIREFCAIWSRLGVEVTGAEATALFKKHGFEYRESNLYECVKFNIKPLRADVGDAKQD